MNAPPLFQFVVDKRHPEEVPLSQLVELLRSAEFGLRHQMLYENPDLDPEEVSLHLVKLEDGSSRYGFWCKLERVAIGAFATFALAATTGEVAPLSKEARKALAHTYSFATRVSSSVSFVKGSGHDHPVAVVMPGQRLAKAPGIRGETQVWVELLKIGGETPPTARIRLHDNTVITCRVRDASLAKEMSPRLYELVGLQGTATWAVDTWRLRDLFVRQMLPYRETDPEHVLRELHNTLGEGWAGIDDRQAYVRRIRDGAR